VACDPPMPYLPRRIRQRMKYDHCVFCKNNGEDQMSVRSLQTVSLQHFRSVSSTGLPDGVFSNRESKFGSISECLAMKDVNFTDIGYSLLPFRRCFGNLVYFIVIFLYFSTFGTLYVPRKFWQP
jgi:hypothetical protein